MISVIVPVYNVEPYLEKCLDSILAQTCGDLEILVIDDGSTDRSGEICDRYAEQDARIRVFHTENRGLSAARNLGLDHAEGEYIGFVDSDDWIEPDMFGSLVKAAEETGTDMVACGFFLEYPKETVEKKLLPAQYRGAEALEALLHREIKEVVWNKLWRRTLFSDLRFPEGRTFEDGATVYQAVLRAESVCSIDGAKYHYVKRRKGLAHTTDMQSMASYWLAHKERYECLVQRVDSNERSLLLKGCARAIGRTWGHYYDNSIEDRDKYREVVREMHGFSKQRIPLFGDRRWGLKIRIAAFFPHFYNGLSFRTARLAYRFYERIRDRNLYET